MPLAVCDLFSGIFQRHQECILCLRHGDRVRVAIITESFLPSINGVTGTVLRVLDHLHRGGHPALVVAPGEGTTEHRGTPVIRVPAVDLPRLLSIPVGLPWRGMFRVVSRFAPDVVHLASPFVVGAHGLAVARRLGVPSVAVYQTDIAGFATAYGMRLTSAAAWRWTCRLHQRADRTLAPSTAVVAALEAHGVPRVFRWGRGVDTEQFCPERRDVALHRKLAPSGELLVGYVGRLSAEKHVERLAAVADMERIRLVVVGEGPRRAELQRLLPDAIFLGLLTGDVLATAYATLDVVVHTGPYETFCQTVQEAMASGTPVIAPDAGGPRDLVAPGRTGLLIPAQAGASELRAAVATLRDNPAKRWAFGVAARHAVRERTWPAVCEELLGHYAVVTAAAA